MQWNAPHPAQKIFGNTYYVGVTGLSSILIDTGKGLILLDGDLVQSVPHIEQNIASLGFHLKDIKFIANSHSHFDHAGGIAELQRTTGATVLASTWGAKALRAGNVIEGDPQFGYAKEAGFPPVKDVRVVRDGEMIALGDVKLVAHYTPGHTPGSTTWTWQSCEGAKCLDIVYADSLNSRIPRRDSTTRRRKVIPIPANDSAKAFTPSLPCPATSCSPCIRIFRT